MYPHQAERLSEALDRARVDAFVATSPENIAYITGFRRLTASGRPEFAVFTRGGTALVTAAHEVPAVIADAVEVDHVVCFAERSTRTAGSSNPQARRIQEIAAEAARGPAEALAAALERLGIRQGKVGMDESRLTHEWWRHLTGQLSGHDVSAGAAHLATARRVKGPYEIECLGHALRLTEEALDVVIQTIDRGMTEREAVTLFSTEVIKRGGWPHRPLVAMGECSGSPAPWATDRALRVGSLVRFDVGCVYKGYCSSAGRTAVLGEPAAQEETGYRAVQAGLEAAIAAVSAGTAAGRVYDAAVEAIRANGLPHDEQDHVGCGIGLELREAPELTARNETPLELGEVLRIEASHCEIGSMGVSAKDTVLVTSAGARVLNRSHHGLVVLE